MESLPALFESFGAEEEYLSEEQLREMELSVPGYFLLWGDDSAL